MEKRQSTGRIFPRLSELIPATVTGTQPLVIEELGPQAAQTYLLDLGVVVPALAITAGLLWRERAWGYVSTGVLLVMASLLAPTLTAITVVDVLSDYVTVSVPLIVGTILPPVVASGFAVKYLLALDGPGANERPQEERGVNV